MIVRTLSEHQLTEITDQTVRAYDDSAESFWRGTKDHDVSQNHDALLQAIEAQPPFRILDLGCGPGRDLLHFSSLGHEAIGLDASRKFVEMARARTGCGVLHQDFLRLVLPDEHYDGVFANASLFHVPRQELPRVLGELRASLRPRGVLFSSNPHGDNREGWSGGRYGCWLDHETWTAVVERAGFVELRHYYRPDDVPLERRPWLATVFRRID